MDFSKFDVRVLERKFKNGEITEKEYKKYLESLEDATEYSEINEDQLLKDAGFKKKEH
ncbi:MAG TPA: hypothetical protein VLJ60_09075 [bacterium]|nr:hypothetical protein [bacterium]